MRHVGIALVCLLAGCPGPGPVRPPSPQPDPEPDQPEPLVAPKLEPVAAGALTWEEDVAQLDVSSGVVVDGDRLVWASEDGGIRAAPRAGGPATLLARFHGVSSLAVAHGRVYALADGAVWSIDAGGTIAGLARLFMPDHLAITDDAIYVADGDWIRAVPLGGGEPVTLTEDAGVPSSIAATSTHVYWTDSGYDRRRGVAVVPCVNIVVVPDDGPHPETLCRRERTLGAVHRVPVRGGEVVTRQRSFPRDVAILGEHVYWADTEGEAVSRTSLDGDDVEAVLPGGARALAVDATSMVVVTLGGEVIEVPPAGTPWIKSFLSSEGEVALAPDMIYVAVDQMVERIPRGASASTVVAFATGAVGAIAVSGTDVYYVDRRGDDATTLMRAPATGGAPVEVRASGVTDVAAAGGRVVTYEGDAGTISVDGEVTLSDVAVTELATDGKTIYWLDEQTVHAASIAGGKVETLWAPAPGEGFSVGYGGGGGPPPSSLQLSDRYLVAAGPTLPGIIRVDLQAKPGKGKKRKPRAEILSEGSTFGGTAGDRVIAWTARGLELFPGGKLLIEATQDDHGVAAIAADATDAYVVLRGDLVRIRLDTGAVETIVPEIDLGDLALTPDALYLGMPYSHAVARIAR